MKKITNAKLENGLFKTKDFLCAFVMENGGLKIYEDGEISVFELHNMRELYCDVSKIVEAFISGDLDKTTTINSIRVKAEAFYNSAEKKAKRNCEAVKKYYSTVDRLVVVMEKGTKDRIKSFGYNINSFVKTLILKELERLESDNKSK